MQKNKQATTVTAYPDSVEPKWQQQQPYSYRTSSYTDPKAEAIGFVLKYSLWALLSVVIAVGLALRNDWGAGTLLVVWGLLATVGYIVIFLLLSVFTPEGVAVVHEYFDYKRHVVEVESQQVIELRRLDVRKELLLAGSSKPEPPALPAKPEMVLPAWRPGPDFKQSIEDELFPVDDSGNDQAVHILADFLIDLYDHADDLLRDNEFVNMQAGVVLPWSRRSEVSANDKQAIQTILAGMEPPLFSSDSGGRVWRLNTKHYPTKQSAIAAISVK